LSYYVRAYRQAEQKSHEFIPIQLPVSKPTGEVHIQQGKPHIYAAVEHLPAILQEFKRY